MARPSPVTLRSRVLEAERPQGAELSQPVETRCVPEVQGEMLDVLETREPAKVRVHAPAVGPEDHLWMPFERGGRGREDRIWQRLIELQPQWSARGRDHGRDGGRVRIRTELGEAVLHRYVERSAQGWSQRRAEVEVACPRAALPARNAARASGKSCATRACAAARASIETDDRSRTGAEPRTSPIMCTQVPTP